MISNYRDAFTDRLQTALIGPGADVYGLDEQTELVSTPPLQLYYSGILFPTRSQPKTIEEEAADEVLTLQSSDITADDEQESEANYTGNTVEANEDEEVSGHSTGDSRENAVKEVGESNHFYPSNLGLTCCVDASVKHITLQVELARYHELSKNWCDKRLRFDKHLYDSILNHPQFPAELKEAMVFESLSETDGILSMPQLPPQLTPAEARNKLKIFRRNAEDKIPVALKRFELLLSSKIYKRVPLIVTKQIDLSSGTSKFTLFENEETGDELLSCHLKCINHLGKQYVKVLIANAADPHPRTKFALSNQALNQKALFQVRLRVEATQLCAYKDHIRQNPFDTEGQSMAYQYRNVHAYGIGHGCAVHWELTSSPTWIETTFLPTVDIQGVSNDFREGQEHLLETARLRNLSIWSPWNQIQTCDSLDRFVQSYADWIESQKITASNESAEFAKLSGPLIAGQVRNLKRLQANINLLRNNRKAFDCFQLANTAMYIQMIISQDSRFSKEEKEGVDAKLFQGRFPDLYNSISFFEQYNEKDCTAFRKNRPIAYRPFQLAFLLLNIESTLNPQSPDRTETVDLLWFPTGGGKTEAYLALTAFTIIWRRTQFSAQCDGVSVIMRYTLRLLTAQQFERASRLIVALEFIRRQQDIIGISLGESPISIGMWVGASTTPNKLTGPGSAHEKLGMNSDDYKTLDYQVRSLNRNKTEKADLAFEKNPFQISVCPWCGCRLITKNELGEFKHGYSIVGKRFKIECRNKHCSFHKQAIPLDVVDESLYGQPPTLLFATVDKFAQLSHIEEGHLFFDSINQQNLPPDLIIQDELHLLNGPLGSVVGLFELMVELLCTRDGRSPKIVASTATTRNTAKQISNLYGKRAVNIFPAPGLTQDDSYFSVATDTQRRRHVGFMATGKTQLDTQVKAILPNLLYIRAQLYNKEQDAKKLNPYWTIVSYYNTLKAVGRTYNKVGDEVLSELRRLHNYNSLPSTLAFNHRGLVYRTSELTSRVDSTKIKQTLGQLEKPLDLLIHDNGQLNVCNNTVDLVLASNMFSVGIDIGRLNVMLMNGQPKNSAEYIQASSRVARQYDGLVVNLLDANVAREKSYFENYATFHQAYYQYVEPLTITPFTETAFEKVLNSILVCYIRHIKKLPKNGDAHDFDGNIEELVSLVKQRIPDDADSKKFAEEHLRGLAEDWMEKIRDSNQEQSRLKYKDGLIMPTENMEEWSLMQSMREVDTNSLLSITLNPLAIDINENEIFQAVEQE